MVTVDFGHAFTYPFEDRKWLEKLAIMSLLTLLAFIPLLGLLSLCVYIGLSGGIGCQCPQWASASASEMDQLARQTAIGGECADCLCGVYATDIDFECLRDLATSQLESSSLCHIGEYLLVVYHLATDASLYVYRGEYASCGD